ncbi:hypothetical protein BJY04DRAFT_168426 [Aspergillus karnatakaensis]|uniref:uncharacterized protein n=1 Tax=Aspergillus karnatakaensis TaxID=1810916 RepID=UPI003CCD262F
MLTTAPGFREVVHFPCTLADLPNLQSLAIRRSDCVVDVDEILFPSLGLLRQLSFDSIMVSLDVLLSLIDRYSESIRRLDLCRVKLKTGYWEQLPEDLQVRRLPHLHTAKFEDCGYLSGESSFNLTLQLPSQCLGQL